MTQPVRCDASVASGCRPAPRLCSSSRASAEPLLEPECAECARELVRVALAGFAQRVAELPGGDRGDRRLDAEDPLLEVVVVREEDLLQAGRQVDHPGVSRRVRIAAI